jgi:hypothetical protein
MFDVSEKRETKILIQVGTGLAHLFAPLSAQQSTTFVLHSAGIQNCPMPNPTEATS